MLLRLMGRVLCVTALGKNTTEAQLNAYNCVEEVNWEGLLLQDRHEVTELLERES